MKTRSKILKDELIEDNKPDNVKDNFYKPHTDFQRVMDKLGIDEEFNLVHKKQKKFNKFKNNVPLYENYNIMTDLLLLPTTSKGYAYLLVAVDLGSNKFDMEPLKKKDARSTLDGLLRIFKRDYVKKPMFSVSTDGGTEFKSVFDQYLKDNSIYHKVGKAYRHSQQAVVESLNNSLSRMLIGYLNMVELETQKEYREWTDKLDEIRVLLNERRAYKNLDKMRSEQPTFNISAESEFKVGDFVHYKLNRPFSALNVPQPTATFRKGDFIYSPEIRQIERIITMNDEPYFRYILNDLPSVSYSDSELILAKRQVKTFLVNKILDRVRQKGITYYLVWYKKELKKDASWQSENALIEDGFQEEIDLFNKEKRKKK